MTKNEIIRHAMELGYKIDDYDEIWKRYGNKSANLDVELIINKSRYT